MIINRYINRSEKEKTMNIYIIEDDDLVRNLLVTQIPEIIPEYKIIGSSGDGLNAIKDCIDLNPDLVIVDIRLPEVNGLEILHVLKKKIPQLKILMYSGIATTDAVEIAMRGKANGYLLKSANFEELVTAMKSINGGGSYFSPEIFKIVSSNRSKSKLFPIGIN